MANSAQENDAHHEKTDLKVFVIFIPFLFKNIIHKAVKLHNKP